jgi:hypothetical protein
MLSLISISVPHATPHDSCTIKARAEPNPSVVSRKKSYPHRLISSRQKAPGLAIQADQSDRTNGGAKAEIDPVREKNTNNPHYTQQEWQTGPMTKHKTPLQAQLSLKRHPHPDQMLPRTPN